MAKSSKPQEAAEIRPPDETKEKAMEVIKHLVKAGLAEKRVDRVPTGNGMTTRTRFIPSALGAGLAGFNGWTMNQAVSEAEFAAGLKAFTNKKAGAQVTDRLAGKGGK